MNKTAEPAEKVVDPRCAWFAVQHGCGSTVYPCSPRSGTRRPGSLVPHRLQLGEADQARVEQLQGQFADLLGGADKPSADADASASAPAPTTTDLIISLVRPCSIVSGATSGYAASQAVGFTRNPPQCFSAGRADGFCSSHAVFCRLPRD